MNKFKNYVLSFFIVFVLSIIFSFFITVLNYFDILNKNVYKALILFFMCFSTFVGSFILGNKTDSKGFLKGIFLGLIIVFFFFVFSFIFKSLSLSSVIYYAIILLFSFIGSSIGINKKTTDK